MRTLKVIGGMVLLIGLVACPKATQVSYAPKMIEGKVVVTVVTESKTACSEPVGTVVSLWFVNSTTIKAVGPNNIVVDLPDLTDWSYKRVDSKTGTVKIGLRLGGSLKSTMNFTSKTEGTYELTGGISGMCGAHHLGTFELKDPPG